MDKEKILDSLLRGLSASVFSAAVVYLGSRAWISMTVSVGPVTKLHSVADAATVLAAASTLVTTTLAAYTAQGDE